MPYLRPVEVVQGESGSAHIVVDSQPSTATVTLEKLSGAAVATLVATVGTYSGSVTSVTSDQTIVLSPDDGDLLIPGRPLLHTPRGGFGITQDIGITSRLWISSAVRGEENTRIVTFETPPIVAFSAGDDLEGCLITAVVPSSATVELGVNYRIRWVVTYADASVKSYDQRCYVVRSGFPSTPSIPDAARFIQANWPSEYELQGGEKLRRVTYAAQDKLRNELLGRGRYAHLTGADSSTFSEAGLLALQASLLMEGYFHADTDRVSYAESLNKRFFGSVMGGLRSLSYYDANADGSISDSEKNVFGGIPAVRY